MVLKQRFINIQLATQGELVDVFPRGAGYWAAPQGSLSTSTNLIRKIELYINNIFVNPEVHEIFIKRIGFSLIRVHRQQIYSASNASDEILLQQLKWPVETLFVGMKMEDYNSSNEATRRSYLDRWHRFCKVDHTSYAQTGFMSYRREVLGTGVETLNLETVGPAPALGTVTASAPIFGAGVDRYIDVGDFIVINGTPYQVKEYVSTTVINVSQDVAGAVLPAVMGVPLPPANLVAATDYYKLTQEPISARVETCTKTIDSLSITAHGIPIYQDFPSMVFNSYFPYHYGGSAIKTPNDIGALMVNFALYPGTYQPSGHINVSRAREFYIKYNSSVISSVDKGQLVVLASTIKKLVADYLKNNLVVKFSHI